MKVFTFGLIVLVFLLNIIAQPAWADAPEFTKSPDYIEVTTTLDQLLEATDAPEQADSIPAETQQKINDLRLQKYILETAEDWSQCQNKTGRMLAIYAHKPKKLNSSQESKLYFIEDGYTTDDDWNCDGIYLPSGVKAVVKSTDTQGQELEEPVAVKIVNGTQLLATTNPKTGAIEFNVAPVGIFKTGEINWPIPNLSPAEIDSQDPTAPID